LLEGLDRPFLKEHDTFADHIAVAVMTRANKGSRAFQTILDVGMSSPVPELRAGILKALGRVSEVGASEEGIRVIQENARAMRAIAHGDPGGADLMEAALVEALTDLWGRYENFSGSSVEVGEYLRLVESTRGALEETVESIATMQEDRLSGHWELVMRGVFEKRWDRPLRIAGRPGESVLPLNLGEIIVGMLKKHPESPRAQRLLEIISEIKFANGKD
jgi:hypothetical protein